MQAGMVGGIILAVIEGLNIALVRMFSTMGPPDEPITMGAAADGNDGQTQMAAAEQPWWAKLIAPPPPPPDVDFSDPKEVNPARGCAQRSRSERPCRGAIPAPCARAYASQLESVLLVDASGMERWCGMCR